MTRAFARLVPVVALATGACFATREDVRLLQTEMQQSRAERAHADSVTRAQIEQVLTAVTSVNDSVETLAQHLTSFQGNVRGELYELGQQLVTIQELTGQSQRKLQEVRASLEQRLDEVPPATVPLTDSSSAAAQPPPQSGVLPPPNGEPGPNTLFQLALDQLRRGSAGAARTAFQQLLTQYPTSDVADDAQFYLGEAYAAESNSAAADSAYAIVLDKYPESPRAPTALYKRAMARMAAGDNVAAKTMFSQLVEKYPRSDEAELAQERLKSLP
jgi:tol-pal system protein YbgF